MPGTVTYIVYKTPVGDGQIRRTADDADILPAQGVGKVALSGR